MCKLSFSVSWFSACHSGLFVIWGLIKRAGFPLQTCSRLLENPDRLNLSPAQVTRRLSHHPNKHHAPWICASTWQPLRRVFTNVMCTRLSAEGSGSGNLSTSSSCSETYTSFSDIKAWSRCLAAAPLWQLLTVHFLLKLLKSLYCINLLSGMEKQTFRIFKRQSFHHLPLYKGRYTVLLSFCSFRMMPLPSLTFAWL